MKRRKSPLCFALCVTVLLSVFPLGGSAAVQTYPDTEKHWAGEAIARWSYREILNGYPDGHFHPDDPVTRAQLAAILDRICQFPHLRVYPQKFADVEEGSWYYDNVMSLAMFEIVTAQGDCVYPNEALTREEAAYMIARAFSVGYDSGRGASSRLADRFEDHEDIDPRFQGYVAEMSYYGFINGFPDGTFQPKENVSRAQVITILDNMIDKFGAGGGTTVGISDGILANRSEEAIIRYISEWGGDRSFSVLFITPAYGSGEVYIDRSDPIDTELLIFRFGDGELKIVNKSDGARVTEVSHTAVALDSYFSGGSGTETDPYLIENAFQFSLMNYYVGRGVGKHYKLISDIDLGTDWLPIGIQQREGQLGVFFGSLDGAGHTVSYGISDTDYPFQAAGLIKELSPNSVIENLNVKAAIDIVSDGSMREADPGDSQLNPYSTRKTSDICLNDGDIGLTAGGIAAISYGTIFNCTADVSVSVRCEDITKQILAGGICGDLLDSAKIEQCTSTGFVSAALPVSYDGEAFSYAGGIAGYAFLLGTFAAIGPVIAQCSSDAEVAASGGKAARAGGIAGGASASMLKKKEYTRITCCRFTGSAAARDGRAQNDSGGIVGSGTNFSVIAKCWTRAQIVSRGAQDYFDAAGGIAGSAYSDTRIENCWADASLISGTIMEGGIAGRLRDSEICNSYVTGAEALGVNAICSQVGNMGSVTGCFDWSAGTETVLSDMSGANWDMDSVWSYAGTPLPILTGAGEDEQKGLQTA